FQGFQILLRSLQKGCPILPVFYSIQGNAGQLWPGFKQEEQAEIGAHAQKQRDDGIPVQQKKQGQKQSASHQQGQQHSRCFFHQSYPFTLRKAPTRSSRPSNTRALENSARFSS